MAIYAVLAFLFPMGIYCLVLASINRRAAPLLVGGFWDTVGLLAAASGFFLVTVPLLLDEFYYRAVGTHLTDTFDEVWFAYWFLWFIYYLFLIAGSAYLLRWRRHKTMIYNVDPELFQLLLDGLFAPLGLEAIKQLQRLVIVPAKIQDTAVAEGLPLSAPAAAVVTRQAEMEVETFPTLCHVTLHWTHYTPTVRREIEKELQKCLERATPEDNPAAGWFLSASGLIFGMATMLLGALLFLLFFRGDGTLTNPSKPQDERSDSWRFLHGMTPTNRWRSWWGLKCFPAISRPSFSWEGESREADSS